MRKLCIKLIKFYQNKMSPKMNKRCKYYPSCSNYGIMCYERFNFFKASFMLLWRLLRCNPWSKGGYDPVPELHSKLIEVKENYYILEHSLNTDRPNLAYIYREDGSYMIDGGNSKKHIKYFYKMLKKKNLPLPKYSIVTHHHWDHTFGLLYTNTHSIGLKETNEILSKQQKIIKEKGIKELFKTKEIPAFCIDHILLEYKHSLKNIEIKLLDEVITEKNIDNLKLFKFPSNHSNDNLVILDNETKILFLGDALCGEIVEYDFIKDKNVINEQLTLLKKLDFQIAIESHCAPKTKEEIIKKLDEKLIED